MLYSTFDLLLAGHRVHPDGIAVIDGDTSSSYAALLERTLALAGWLQALGVRRGDRVGIHVAKSVDEIAITFAIARIGAVYVNVNPQLTVRQLEHIVKDAGIQVLFCDGGRARDVVQQDWFESLTWLVVRGRPPEAPRCVSLADLPADARPSGRQPIGNDLAALMYTSGSTGLPKGVMFTHRNVVDGARIVSDYLGNTASDRALSLLSISFDYGMSQVTTMFLVGGTVVLQAVAMPSEIIRTCQRHGVTGLPLVPNVWIPVVRALEVSGERIPSLRYCTNTGGKIPEGILDLLPEVFPGARIFLMYGLTEAFRSSFLPPELFATKKGSIGRAIPDVELFVVDEDRGLCGPGEQGQLLHRGALVSQGYWNRPDATEAKIRPNRHLASLIGDEPVVHSGDLVQLDEDGVLWFVNRLDQMIKSRARRISPTEVEDLVFSSGLVEHVVAFGVPHEELGAIVAIAVTPRDPSLESRDLLQFCRKEMPLYMIPGHVVIWTEDLPRTGSGKIDRPRVIAQSQP